MMDPQLKTAIVACRASCKASIQALSGKQPSLDVSPNIGDAFAQCLVNFRQTVTSLGMAFKPPVTVPAATQQLEKISDQLSQLIACVLITHGEMGKEWKEGILDISGEVERHLDVLEAEGDYLQSTGKIWEAIDRMSRDLSRDEKSAITRRWKIHQSIVKDAWDEFKEILEDNQNRDDDGGWDELGLGGTSLSEGEKSRAEAIKPLLSLHQLLHASIPRYFDQAEDHLQVLLEESSKFVDCYDELVSSLHPEQDEEEIDSALGDIEKISRGMASLVGNMSTDKWAIKYDMEKGKWSDRKFDMRSLAVAIE
ncbi:hypothetical protein AYX14_06224 [Cryptococcus neoformans]|nr:hypothetical protein AYX15_03025 [Cryptococcus neoformans var. grubii]OWZ65489.1 hypothetical protein AYX14_06224 [Cryptococcus neoformans var. grubii]OWZ76959.1 hypothetical protein C365_04216 [Cryptococcus neoformans var. grubii Bt85]OXG14462.1 hypothetical protein C366_04503 [Cryptococcus neoformans var. grubii Tu401-1]OXM77549.1 hypothetical protein C364_04487 [Cryptococcus neoformans var. grubii Bt63]